MTQSKQQLLEEINQCRNKLKIAHAQLNHVIDHDMIDSCIYEIKALESKHKCLMNKYKALEAA